MHQVGSLSARDLFEVDRRLRQAMALTGTAIGDLVNEVDLATQPAGLVQVLAEKSAAAVVLLAAANTPDVDVERLQKLLAK